MTTATAVRRQLAVFVGVPERGEIGRDEILMALRRAGARADRIRMQAAEAARRSSVCKDRRFE